MAVAPTAPTLRSTYDSSPETVERLARSARAMPEPVEELLAWLADRRLRNPCQVVPVPFAQLEGWSFAPGSDDLVHDSGRFFSVEGVHVRTDYGYVPEWWQPIIHQPDRAILGILARERDGVLQFLMQAKVEPGNVNGAQFSPTVQATTSNYLRTHKGAGARYLEYFSEPGRARALVDILQSEQGSWFRGKRNRNIVMEVDGDVEHHDDFRWLTLGQILALLHYPNAVNMDARTVLSCLPLPARAPRPAEAGFNAALWRSITGDGRTLLTLGQGRSWLTMRKALYTLATRQVPLGSVAGWLRDESEIYHRDRRYFRILGVNVRATNREVHHWCQPLLAPQGLGLVAFIVRRIDGVLHVLARADLRPGYRDTVELGPTVQCTPANFIGLPARRWPRYLDLVLSGAGQVRYDVLQSEEGGRFYQALTRHMVLEVGEDFPLDVPDDFAWLTAAQLKALVAASYQVNIEARSLLLCLHALS